MKEVIINGILYVPKEPEFKTYKIDNLEWSESSDYKMNWEEANSWCKAHGKGWKLPTRTELITLIDDTKYNHCCKIDECMSSDYWSSITNANSSDYAWLVDFYDGNVNYGYKSDTCHVRAVRF